MMFETHLCGFALSGPRHLPFPVQRGAAPAPPGRSSSVLPIAAGSDLERWLPRLPGAWLRQPLEGQQAHIHGPVTRHFSARERHGWRGGGVALAGNSQSRFCTVVPPVTGRAGTSPMYGPRHKNDRSRPHPPVLASAAVWLRLTSV